MPEVAVWVEGDGGDGAAVAEDFDEWGGGGGLPHGDCAAGVAGGDDGVVGVELEDVGAAQGGAVASDDLAGGDVLVVEVAGFVYG